MVFNALLQDSSGSGRKLIVVVTCRVPVTHYCHGEGLRQEPMAALAGHHLMQVSEFPGMMGLGEVQSRRSRFWEINKTPPPVDAASLRLETTHGWHY